MIKIVHIVKRELIDIARDYQSFIILIIMPTAFILVMSLSMQALFQSHSTFKMRILAIDMDRSPESRSLISSLHKVDAFSVTEAPIGTTEESASKAVLEGEYKFALILKRGYAAYARDLNMIPAETPVVLFVDPTLQVPTQLVIKHRIEMEITRLRLDAFLARNEEMLSYVGLDRHRLIASVSRPLNATYVYSDRREAIVPNAAQQSVPAWIVFSMYYIVIPIASIFFTEKSNGTFLRLRSIRLAASQIIAGKLITYYLVGLIQAACMLAVGRYLVPLLGGDTITLGKSPAGLFIMITCISINAIAFGLLVSVSSKSMTMAIALGIVTAMILAAIGGIMVPTFVMPHFMQTLAHGSLPYWGMQGMLDIMLRNGTIRDILPECGVLLAAALVMMACAALVLRKKKI